jgi:hypothetical protein
MTQFGNALAGGLRAIRRLAGQPVAYVAGLLSIPIALAVNAKDELDSVSEEAVLESTNVVDWSFEAVLLVDGSGNVFEPSPGHRIVATTRGRDTTYEAVIIPGRKCFDYLDTDASTIVVHTQRII